MSDGAIHQPTTRLRGEDGATGAVVPALRFHWLTRVYDPVVRFTTREHRFKRRLLDHLEPRTGQTILDLGCGTGTFAAMSARRAPGARVVGIDADAAVLDLAGTKLLDGPDAVDLVQGLSFSLPFPDASFDAVVSSLFFHHLTTENKRRTLAEVHRVLVPGGVLQIADWARGSDLLMRSLSLSIRLLDGFETTAANFAGELPELVARAGFDEVRERSRLNTVYGTIALLSGRRPD